MDSLEECGIRYLTARSIQEWRDAPALWVLKHLYGIHSYKSSAVARSIAVKDGLRHCLYRNDERIGEDIAMEVYAGKLKEWGIDPAADGPRSDEDDILPLLSLIVKEILAFSGGEKPLSANIATSILVDEVSAPLLSVADFVFSSFQIKVKIGNRCPSSIQPRDMAALALDAKVRKQIPLIFYATRKRVAWFESDRAELDEAYRRLIGDAERLENFIGTAESPGHALSILPFNTDHYLWKPDLLEAANTIIATTRRQDIGFICAKGTGRLPERPSRKPRFNLLPDSGSWDAEGEVE